ncbi:MAG: hypothetical protein Q9162_005047 [Coniocarpon cinnabarinum]
MYNSPSAAAFPSPRSPASPPDSHHGPPDPYGHHRYPSRDDRRLSPPPPTSAPHAAGPAVNGNSSYPAPTRPPKTFYDPTAEEREQKQTWHHSGDRSPVLRKNSFSNYPPSLHDPPQPHHASPTSPSRSQTSPVVRHVAQTYRSPELQYRSPPLRPVHHNMAPPPAAVAVSEHTPQTSPKRAANPMSFSNILADADDTRPPPPRSPPSTRKTTQSSTITQQTSPDLPRAPLPPVQSPTRHRHTSSAHERLKNDIQMNPSPRPRTSSLKQHSRKASAMEKSKPAVAPTPPPKPKILINEKDYEAALRRIDNMEMSEPDDTGFETFKRHYAERQLKRWRSVENLEGQKRKVSYCKPPMVHTQDVD